MLILNTVPLSDPKVSSILHISVGSGMLVKYSSGLSPLGSHASVISSMYVILYVVTVIIYHEEICMIIMKPS